MRAFGIREYGGIDAVTELDVPWPKAGPTEVVIKLAYASVNPVDAKITLGYMKGSKPERWPIVLGWDAAGIISAVGDRVRNFKIGDRVFADIKKAYFGDGTFAEAVGVEADVVAHAPATLSLAQAAAFPLASLTAWQALFEVGTLRAGQTALIHAGAGGVGGFALQFARWKGAKTFTTAREVNHPYVRQLGANWPIDYQHQDFVAVVREQFPEGVDFVFDTMGGKIQERSLEILKPGGKLVSILGLGERAKAQPNRAAFFFVRPDGKQLAQIAQLIDAGTLQCPQIQIMPLEKVKEALRTRLANASPGKIVLEISGGAAP
jgi:NADPH:quinone reductase-like Zn-dependent oxidoreductase